MAEHAYNLSTWEHLQRKEDQVFNIILGYTGESLVRPYLKEEPEEVLGEGWTWRRLSG